MNDKYKFKVLLVEDDPDHALIAKMTLRKIFDESDIEHVIDGKKALNKLSTRVADTIPKLTILDLNLPGVNGFEILEFIRNDVNLKDHPVVILTTSKNEKDLRKAVDLGILEYFIKPLDINQLRRIVHSIDSKEKLNNINMNNVNWKTMSFII